ncbi:DUF5623 domain-containing protein [Undibacterium sp. TJN19]|uniref:DUF5623 domain-containing protein n=1 Tax=Undibacterium sp. TJN19 TaxID=3413055 RepID=UPI003BF412C5
MTKESLRPSTLIGIKSLAKDLKLEKKIQHSEALNQAARMAGFSNFSHAQNQLLPTLVKHSVFLTVYWRDTETKKTGRETLTLQLSKEWSDLITSRHLQIARALSTFLPEGPDHLVRQIATGSQSAARRVICAAARTLQFIDATKLRPSKAYSRVLPKGISTNIVPESDHSSVWFSPETKKYLFADEPYEAAVKNKHEQRTAWAIKHDFVIERPSWPGMYNPDGGSQLYLISDAKKGIPLAHILAALSDLPIPIVEDTWNGESAEIYPRFISPGQLKHLTATKKETIDAPNKPIAARKSMSLPARRQLDSKRSRDFKMPVTGHREVGRLLKSVLIVSFHRKGVYNRLNQVRSNLDEWAHREYRELPSHQIVDFYYRENGMTFSRAISSQEREKQIRNLEEARRILSEHYLNSASLRPMLGRLDSAIKSMQTWK